MGPDCKLHCQDRKWASTVVQGYQVQRATEATACFRLQTITTQDGLLPEPWLLRQVSRRMVIMVLLVDTQYRRHLTLATGLPQSIGARLFPLKAGCAEGPAVVPRACLVSLGAGKRC